MFSGGSGIFYPHRRGVSKPHPAIPGRVLPGRACVRFTGYGKYGFPGLQSHGFTFVMAFLPAPLSGFMEFAVSLLTCHEVAILFRRNDPPYLFPGFGFVFLKPGAPFHTKHCLCSSALQPFPQAALKTTLQTLWEACCNSMR